MATSVEGKHKLVLIKSIHTLVWMVFAVIIAYVLWSGVTSNISIRSWLAVIAVLVEGLVLVIFKGKCPLTVIARKYSDSTKENFDIYLPLWLAKYNKQIFSFLYIVGLALMLRSYFQHS